MENKFLFMARGPSHVKYFKKLSAYFKSHKQINIIVYRPSKSIFNLKALKYINIIKPAILKGSLALHFSKKKKAHPILSESLFWPIYCFIRSLLEYYYVAKHCAVIKKIDPTVVGVWNGQKFPSSSIMIAAKILKKQVLYFENGLIPNTTVCDWKGVNCENSIPRDPSFYRSYRLKTLLNSNEVKREIKLTARTPTIPKSVDSNEILIPKEYIFVPFQVETDSQIIRNSPWLKSMDELFDECIVQLNKNSKLFFVFKEHPSENRSYKHLYGQHKRAIFCNSACTQTLITNAISVLTINSTVGIESILLGKMPIVLGNACYKIESLSHMPKNSNELIDVLASAELGNENKPLHKTFIKFLNNDYCIPSNWLNVNEDHLVKLEARLLKIDNMAKLPNEQKPPSEARQDLNKYVQTATLITM